MKTRSLSLPAFIRLSKFWQDNHVFLREFKHFPKALVIGVLASIFASALEGIGMGLILSFLQGLIDPTAKALQTGISWFDNAILGVNQPPDVRLFYISALILFVTWLRAAMLYIQNLYVAIIQNTLIYRLRIQVFEQLQSLNLSYFTQTRLGELINTLTTEISRLWLPFIYAAGLITLTFSLLVYVITIFALSWQMSLLAVASLTLLSVGLSTLKKYIRESSFAVTAANGHFTSVAVELISSIFTVHAFDTQDFERQRFYRASADIKRKSIINNAISMIVTPLSGGMGFTIILGILILGFVVFKVPPATLLTFIYALMRLVPVVQQMNQTATGITECYGSLTKVKELLERGDKPYFKNGTRIFTGLQRSIEFCAVDFSYDADSPVLHNISLEIKKGQTTALVGSSGAGKTTLAALVPRFYDPTQGQILLDGIDIASFDISSLRQRIAIVSQETFIFNASVRENITYGTAGASDEEIWRVAKLANALDFIVDLPEGLNTPLGDRGANLSGGQRQRISIARALLRDPEILILDEATSALDSVSEQLIQTALEKLSVNRTVIAIAHRLSTIAHADKVVVLEQGRVVEQGSYQDLLGQKGKLWQYYQVQFKGSGNSELSGLSA
jgi:ATP-binding cassette, subfamily B, bacterial MsbA